MGNAGLVHHRAIPEEAALQRLFALLHAGRHSCRGDAAVLVALQSHFGASWGPASYVVFLLVVTGMAIIFGTTKPVDDEI